MSSEIVRSLDDPARLAALADLGLGRDSDPGMERFARRVRDLLSVPVSLVSLVQADQQVFPGMCGLPEPWAAQRSTPLSHSFCQHVVDTAEPLVIEDARLVPLVADNLAIADLGVIAYAGMPLTDDDGHVLGSLCAIDTVPRAWTSAELEILRETALDCSNELRRRLARWDASRERERRDAIDRRLQVSMDRSFRLLSIAEALNTCRTVDDVRRELAGFVDRGTGLIDVRLHTQDDPEIALPTVAPIAPSWIQIVEDLDSDWADLPSDQVTQVVERGGRSVGFLPVRGSGGHLATIELVWDRRRRLDGQEHAMAAALSAYAGQALERAILLDHRISVAHQLQAAMLTEVPTDLGVDAAACYLPADAGEMVGGDWYDVLPATSIGDGPALDVLFSVGDVTGHEIDAAATMGQVRAMLRQIAWDLPDGSPAEHLATLEDACETFGVPATGSAVLGRLRRDAEGWELTWVNAGHPAPVVVDPDGTLTVLDGHDLLFGHPYLLDEPRTDHAVRLRPGSLLLVHTDGLVDDPRHEPEDQVARLHDAVLDAWPGDAETVVERICASFTGLNDDVVALAVVLPD